MVIPPFLILQRGRLVVVFPFLLVFPLYPFLFVLHFLVVDGRLSLDDLWFSFRGRLFSQVALDVGVWAGLAG